MNMKILFITMNAFSRYVTYKRAVGTGEGLAKLGHEVHIVALDCAENRARMAAEAPHCIPQWYKSSSRIVEVHRKLRIVWRLRPDYVYSSTFSLRNLGGLRFLFPLRTRTILEFCELYSAMKAHRARWIWLERLALLTNDRFLCASKYLERNIIDRLGQKDKNRVMYSPYAYPSYLHKESRRNQCGENVLFMASLWRGYGVFDVMEAVRLIAMKGRRIHLDILGKGPDLENAKNWILENKMDREISLHGYVAEEDLHPMFLLADVFVSPLHDTAQDWARCPSKLYYYIPYDKPIVTCKIGDPHDTLGPSGFYYEHDNIQDMACAIERALDASSTFSYPLGFIENHSWDARAKQFDAWIRC